MAPAALLALAAGSTGLISIDASGPTSADVPPEARLGDAPHLQEFRDAAGRLDVAPRHVVQRVRPEAGSERVRRALRGGGGAVLVHLALAAGLVYLLSFRDDALPGTVETPVEVVVEPAKPPTARSSPRRR